MATPGIHPYHHRHWAPPPAIPPSILVENPNRPTTDENLLRWLPGYEASQVNFKGDQPMGFALFSTAQQAMAAKTTLQELVFDAEKKFVLHMEMAKKNLFVKRGVVTNSSSFDPSKRLRTGGEYTHIGYPSPPSPAPPPAAPVWGAAACMAPFDPYGAYQVPQVPAPAPAPLPAPSGYTPQNVKDNPPCNTLFIGNLGENIIEEELNGLFSVQSGYKRMKLLRQERNTDANSAMAVHQNLQGAVFPSSGSNTMFSKNSFGRRKDSVNGAAPEAN